MSFSPIVSADIDLVYNSEHRERRTSAGTPAVFHTTFRGGGYDVNLKFKKSKWRQDRVPFHYYQDGVKYEHATHDDSEVFNAFLVL